MPAPAVEATGIAVFAKAPIEGYAKTRLAARLGARRAADLHLKLVERTLSTACECRVGAVSLWCAPDTRHPAFTALAARFGVALHAQRGADLGGRMLDAFERLTPACALLVVGTDCPVLSGQHLRACSDALHAGDDVVMLPTEDGGYALIGATRPIPALFHGIEWSTSQVLHQTRRRLSDAGLRFTEPATLWDIDRPEDYERACALGLLEDVLAPPVMPCESSTRAR